MTDPTLPALQRRRKPAMGQTEIAVRREWCFRCEEVFVVGIDDRAAEYAADGIPVGRESELCPRAPGRHRHEGMAADPPQPVRPESSLHSCGCPRSNPWTLLPASVPCMCASLP